VVSVTDPYGRILGTLDRSRCFSIKYPVPDPLLFFSGSARNRTRASGSVAKNSDHQTTEAVSRKSYADGKFIYNILTPNFCFPRLHLMYNIE
jgi:hypothetical protein